MKKTMHLAAALTAVLAIAPSITSAQLREQRIVEDASRVFDEVVSLHLQAIPQSLLSGAEGVAIIPNVIKGGFVVGARHGKGVLLVRDDQGVWELPVFISLTGGNVGWQIGVQSTDLILVFKTRKSIDGILNGKLTLGADAAAAAGPVGRQASAATDGRLQAEIYSYSRSRGLFAGVSVDGSVLRVEPELNAAFYENGEFKDDYYAPEAAVQLVNKVANYCLHTHTYKPDGEFVPEEAAPEELPPPRMNDFSAADVVRRQLAQSAGGLPELLDRQWMSYLAIPPQVYQKEGPHPSREAVQRSLTRLEVVAEDPGYRVLSKREEFQRTLSLLREYERVLPRPETALLLPPPPSASQAEAALRR